MQRRQFLKSAAVSAAAASFPSYRLFAAEQACCRTFATPAEAMRSPREELVYVVAIYVGTGRSRPDYLATVDVDPKSERFGQVVHRLPMPNVGDELHHFGWNACASCHGERDRRFLVIPGLRSSRIHIVDTQDPREPKMVRVIEPREVVGKSGLSAPHTVHCRADGHVMISMLGDAQGEGPGGFLLLNQEFDVVGAWANSREGMHYNYDFWYQPRHNVMVSSEWAAPRTILPGFSPEDVKQGKYGRHLNFWDWKEARIAQSIDLGEDGWMPLEVRFHHDPDSTHGYVGAAFSSTMWHWHKDGDRWDARKVIAVEPVEAEGRPTPLPGLITDLLLSMDDRWLYFSTWLHGDVFQYDVSDPAHPRLAGKVRVGGALGEAPVVRGKRLVGGPQMLQLSLDGKRLYVTNSLFSSWDNQFYPAIAEKGSYLLSIDCDTDRGGLALNEEFVVDFGREPCGPARAHEMRLPNGDCTSDIWV